MRSSTWSRNSKSRTKRTEADVVACISEESTGAIEEVAVCVAVDEDVEEEAAAVVVEAREARDNLRLRRQRLLTTHDPSVR
jgi:hypothetical protein